MRWNSRWYEILRLGLLTLILVIITMPINAYLVDGDRSENLLIFGGNQISVREEFETPQELIPGKNYVKRVRVENSGHSDCYVRIKTVFTDSRVGKYCSLDWNMNDFTYCEEDGFYYYRDILSAGEMTTHLFTTISVSGEFPADRSEDCSILVYAESCQSEGFEHYEDAWAYWGRNHS